MAYINVDEVYILDNTGAQVDAVTDIPFKQDAGLTDAQKARARANLGISAGGGGVNRNLLDNPWFTVNQRGATGASSSSYGLDRWKGIHEGYTVNNDGSVTIAGTMRQLGDWSYVWGKTVTISAMLTSGQVYSWTGALSAGSKSVGGVMTVVVTSATEINFNAVSNLKALKLELGSTSTLAQDAPPDYAEELRKCQWYFRRIKSAMSYAPVGYGFQTSSVVCNMKIAGGMRVAPTPTFSGTLRLVGNTSASIDVTSLSAGQTDAEGVVIKANTAGSLSANHAYTMYLSNGSYIDLSADL